jgi:predicted porin
MKKSLFAIAAVTAFAGAAQAQSSVTVYGILDMGYSNTSTRAGVSKVQSSGFTTNAETDSRLGFRGNEDLGGGTSAFFTIEAAIAGNNGGAPQYGGVTQTSGNAANVIQGNRQTFIGLAQKGIGRGAIGTQYTPIHDAVAATDPGGSNNVIGSIIRPIGAGVANNANSGASGNHLVRTTNALKFNSDKFAGFGLNAMYALNAVNRTQTGAQVTTAPSATNATALTAYGNDNYSGYGISVDYTWKKLYATAAMNQFSQEQTFTGQSATTSLPATETQGSQTNVKLNDVYAAATYDFGVVKAFGAYTNRKITGALNSNQYLKRSGQQLGVRSFITPKVEGWASIGNGKYQAFGTTTSANFNAWQLGTNYWLSKRSNVYGIYGQQLTSSSGQTANQGAAGSQFALGVRHTF